MLTHVFNLSDMLRHSKTAGWNGDDSSVLPAHALPSPRKRLCMEKVVLWMLTPEPPAQVQPCQEGTVAGHCQLL